MFAAAQAAQKAIGCAKIRRRWFAAAQAAQKFPSLCVFGDF